MTDTLFDVPTAILQIRTIPGNVRLKLANVLKGIAEARRLGARIVVLYELSLSDYMLGDRWEHDAFIREIEEANDAVRKASIGLTVIWGSVRADWDRIGEDGRVRKYNAAFIAHDGEWVRNRNGLLGWIPKTNLPKYRIFDDARHFYPAAKLASEMSMTLEDFLQPFEVTIGDRQVRLAIAVCEDLWEDEYNSKPSRIYRSQRPDLLIDISQSPWTHRKWHAREGMLKRRSRDAGVPILYVNSVGLQNNGKNLVWFDGSSSFISKEGEFLWRAPQHEEGVFMLSPAPAGRNANGHAEREGVGEIFSALIAAMREFYAPFRKVVIGLSGGIDSALSAALLVEAVGADRVLAVNMPTEYNTRTTRSLAEECARNLGIRYIVVPIQGMYEMQLALLGKAGYADPAMLVKENLQARLRGNQLATIASCEGGVFTNNGNKTEAALNYFTLYGDGAGAAAFLADLWKGQVYALARFINERARRPLIPQGIIDLIPSAELSAEQNVEEGKGDPIFYEYHDELLRMFIEHRWDPTMVLERAIAGTLERELGCPPGTIERRFKSRQAFTENLEWAWRQYNIEWKRVQFPPVFLTSRRAFGFDRRDTIADAYFPEAYYCRRAEYLGEAI